MEVVTKYNVVFIILKNVENRPGILAEIMKNMHNAKIGVEYLHAVSVPGAKTGDIMIIIKAEDKPKALPIVEKIKPEIKGEKIVIVEDLAGLVIRGISSTTASEALDKVFSICANMGVNIIMAYTTLVTLNIFIETEDLSMELIETMMEALKEKWT